MIEIFVGWFLGLLLAVCILIWGVLRDANHSVNPTEESVVAHTHPSPGASAVVSVPRTEDDSRHVELTIYATRAGDRDASGAKRRRQQIAS